MIILEGTGPDHQAHGPAANRAPMLRPVVVEAGSGNRQGRRLLTMIVYADGAAKPGADHPTIGRRRVVSKIAVADERIAICMGQVNGATVAIHRAIPDKIRTAYIEVAAVHINRAAMVLNSVSLIVVETAARDRQGNGRINGAAMVAG